MIDSRNSKFIIIIIKLYNLTSRHFSFGVITQFTNSLKSIEIHWYSLKCTEIHWNSLKFIKNKEIHWNSLICPYFASRYRNRFHRPFLHTDDLLANSRVEPGSEDPRPPPPVHPQAGHRVVRYPRSRRAQHTSGGVSSMLRHYRSFLSESFDLILFCKHNFSRSSHIYPENSLLMTGTLTNCNSHPMEPIFKSLQRLNCIVVQKRFYCLVDQQMFPHTI